MLRRNMLRRSNKGVTLVELLVALALLAILMAQIASIVFNSSKLYKNGVSEVELQSEAQQFVNQLQELMIDCDNSISFNYAHSISEDALITISNNDCKYEIQLTRDPANLTTRGGLVTMTKTGSSDPFATPVLMAEYVESISINQADYETQSKITIDVVMSNDNYSYSSSTDLYLRNGIGFANGGNTAPDTTAFDFELDVMRYKEYNLDTLFGEEGHSYEYVWETGNKSYYEGIVDDGSGNTIKCGPHLNTNFDEPASDPSAKLSYGPFNIVRKDVCTSSTCTHKGEEKLINVSTKKVVIGAGGSLGASIGSGLCYQSAGTSAEYESFIPVFGIDLASAESAVATFGIYIPSRHKFGDGGAEKDGCFEGLSPVNISHDELTSRSNSLGDLTTNIYCKDPGHADHTIQLQNNGGFVTNVDVASNSCVLYSATHLTNEGYYYKLISEGGAAVNTVTYTFGSGTNAKTLKINAFVYPVGASAGGGGTPAGPAPIYKCYCHQYEPAIYEDGHCKYCSTPRPGDNLQCPNASSCNAWYAWFDMVSPNMFKCPNCGTIIDKSSEPAPTGDTAELDDTVKEKFYDTVEHTSF